MLRDPDARGRRARRLDLPMNTTRLEAFSDGVIAILITIMVLDLKIPHGTDFGCADAAVAGLPDLRVELHLSSASTGRIIITCSIWSERVSGAILWANLNLLFWLSLIPFTTGWMGENHFARLPTAVYGCVLLAAALAYTHPAVRIVRHRASGARLAAAVGRDREGQALDRRLRRGHTAAFMNEWIADALYVAVAAMWLIPDRRIESQLADRTLSIIVTAPGTCQSR